MPKKLIDYSKDSPLMKLNIKYGEETYKFNLAKELNVNEEKLNSTLLEHPQSFAFLGMLHKRYIKLVKQADKERKEISASRYLHYKSQNTDGGRGPSDEVCKAKVEIDEMYKIACRKVYDLEEVRDNLEVCVRSFEERKDLIQTLAANLRKENK